jgi:hypothetical protein
MIVTSDALMLRHVLAADCVLANSVLKIFLITHKPQPI